MALQRAPQRCFRYRQPTNYQMTQSLASNVSYLPGQVNVVTKMSKQEQELGSDVPLGSRDKGDFYSGSSSSSKSSAYKNSKTSAAVNATNNTTIAPAIPYELAHQDELLRQYEDIERYRADVKNQAFLIFADQTLPQIVPKLCAQDRVEDVAANLVYYALDVFDGSGYDQHGIMFRKSHNDFAANDKKMKKFQSDIYQTCSLLFESHFKKENAESLFGILNEKVMKKASPSLRQVRRRKIQRLILDSIGNYVWLNQEAFQRVDIDKIWRVAGSKSFVKLVHELKLNVRAMSRPCFDALMHVLLKEKPTSLFDAMALVFGCFKEVRTLDEYFRLIGVPRGYDDAENHDGSRQTSLEEDAESTELLGNFKHRNPKNDLSMHSLKTFLERICARQSRHLLKIFFQHLAECDHAESLCREALDFLNLRNRITGHAVNPWGCQATSLLLLEEAEKEIRRNHFIQIGHGQTQYQIGNNSFSSGSSIGDGQGFSTHRNPGLNPGGPGEHFRSNDYGGMEIDVDTSLFSGLSDGVKKNSPMDMSNLYSRLNLHDGSRKSLFAKNILFNDPTVEPMLNEFATSVDDIDIDTTLHDTRTNKDNAGNIGSSVLQVEQGNLLTKDPKIAEVLNPIPLFDKSMGKQPADVKFPWEEDNKRKTRMVNGQEMPHLSVSRIGTPARPLSHLSTEKQEPFFASEKKDIVSQLERVQEQTTDYERDGKGVSEPEIFISENPTASAYRLPDERIFFIDQSAQLSSLHKILQNAANHRKDDSRHMNQIAISYRASFYSAVSVLIIATERNGTFLIDVLPEKSEMYIGLVLHLLRSVLEAPRCRKIVFDFGDLLLRLQHLFSGFRPVKNKNYIRSTQVIGRYSHVVDLAGQREMREKRTVYSAVAQRRMLDTVVKSYQAVEEAGEKMKQEGKFAEHSNPHVLIDRYAMASKGGGMEEMMNPSLHEVSAENSPDPNSDLHYTGEEIDEHILINAASSIPVLIRRFGMEEQTVICTELSRQEKLEEERRKAERIHEDTQDEVAHNIEEMLQGGHRNCCNVSSNSLITSENHELGDWSQTPRPIDLELREHSYTSSTYDRSNWNFRPLSKGQVAEAARECYRMIAIESELRKMNCYPSREWTI